jgi:eukaryotic-like serine/threonine-protein kinase
LTPERVAGRYRVERRLGLGGMSVVQLAHDEVLDRPVALKLLSDPPGRDEELRNRFLREGRLAAKLSHPNVVAVYDTGVEDEQPYIVMEYVEGCTLADEVHRRGPLPPAEVTGLGAQACAGLAHAHEAGIVHRDVKPHNLLLRRDGVLKVADFGIARGTLDQTLTQAGTLLGTAAYLAPEVLRGERATTSSDIYGLGAVLYELLTGRPPRRVESFADLGGSEPITEPGLLVPDPPAALVAVIMRCLEPDPRARPASASALAQELEPAAARTEALAARPRPLRVLWVGLACALGAGFAVLALPLGGEDDPAPPQQVQRVPAASGPADAARNLSEWLRANSARRGGG